MLSTISRLRWSSRPSFSAVLGNNLSPKSLNEAEVSINKNLLGYVRVDTIRLYNTSNNRFQRTKRLFSSLNDSAKSSQRELDPMEFDKVSEETLESLTDYFDDLVERAAHLQEADVSYRDGVLTIKFGEDYGTYVINRQTPNKQIWLSSPTSGPKRYDFIGGKWVYRHDGRSLHDLLNEEISIVVKSDTAFDRCSHSGQKKSLSP